MIGFHSNLKSPWKSIIFPSLISSIFVFLSQFSLIIIPLYFTSSPLLTQLVLSALVLLVVAGFGKSCRFLLVVSSSAPAFVFFNILFTFGVHIIVIRKGIPLSMSVLVSLECAFLVVGLYRILSSDPGWITLGDSSLNTLIQNPVSEGGPHSEQEEFFKTGLYLEEHTVPRNQESFPMRRGRYCKSCKAHVRGFDHHCPAFGNCIGQRNHFLFMVLLLGFIITEVSYIVCSSQFIRMSRIMDKAVLETSLSSNLAISTMVFSLLQVLWQVPFLLWHIYCACFNIKTDEWVNWMKYPEFQLHFQAEPWQSLSEVRFINPYDKGVLGNIKDFLTVKDLAQKS